MPTLSIREHEARLEALRALLGPCTLCPHQCRVDRLSGDRGRCGLGNGAVLCSAVPHFGEEPPISGTRGSGTLFFGSCNLRCRYCQNWQISQSRDVRRRHPTPIREIADAMLRLQAQGCHNVSLVTASHVVPYAVEALLVARRDGLRIPVVYNTSSYDGLETLRLLDGIVDVYLADLRYSDDREAWRYSKAPNYSKHSRAAVLEMARQVGTKAVLGEDGTLARGLVIRVLVLPNDIAGVEDTLRFIRNELGAGVTISLLAQYTPAFKANEDILLSRPVYFGEYLRALETVEELGFENVYAQTLDAPGFYNPDFSNPEAPFVDARYFQRRC